CGHLCSSGINDLEMHLRLTRNSWLPVAFSFCSCSCSFFCTSFFSATRATVSGCTDVILDLATAAALDCISGGDTRVSGGALFFSSLADSFFRLISSSFFVIRCPVAAVLCSLISERLSVSIFQIVTCSAWVFLPIVLGEMLLFMETGLMLL